MEEIKEFSLAIGSRHSSGSACVPQEGTYGQHECPGTMAGLFNADIIHFLLEKVNKPLCDGYICRVKQKLKEQNDKMFEEMWKLNMFRMNVKMND